MSHTRKTAIYCRTALADDIALATQEKQLREYAKGHRGAEIICFRDNGANGNTLGRPAMTAMIAGIKADEIGTVIATDAARIARNFTLTVEWRELLDRYGVEFVTLDTAMNGINYIRVGDYLLPNLSLSDPPDAPPLGYCGIRHKAYLRENKPALYSELLLTERLYPLCREIDEAAANRRALGMSESEIIRELVCN